MNAQTKLARYDFKRKLEELRSIKGSATELISLYISPSRQISDVMAYLRNELSQSSNIKSKSTRKNVMAAIESIMNRLKQYKKPPENGLVFFVGHRAKAGDQTEMVAFVIEPPEPINTYLYRCDSEFYLEPLEELLEEKESFGLLVVDRKEATVGILKGKKIETLRNIQSRVPSKHGRGGQSQQRFERLIEIAAHEYFKKVGETVNEAFLNNKEIKGILVGGPGATKEFFVENDYLHHELKKKVIGLFDTGYTDEYGLRELVENSSEALSNLGVMKEKKLIQRLMMEIVKPDRGFAAYGEDEIRTLLQTGAVSILLISEGLRKYRLKVYCNACNFSNELTVTKVENRVCPECGSPLSVKAKVDIIQELSELAESSSATVELISDESEEGKMLLKAFGGIAALLRFKPES